MDLGQTSRWSASYGKRVGCSFTSETFSTEPKNWSDPRFLRASDSVREFIQGIGFCHCSSNFGIALALVGGWLGGELVERLGIGVHAGAHPNAPNSLSGRPASEQAHDAGVALPRPRGV